MSTITDIFNPGGITTEENKQSDLYTPSQKQGKGGVYKSVIRFLPWHVDPNNSIMSKYVAYLVNPANPSESKYVDNPSERSPITDVYWRLVNTKKDQLIEFAKKHLSSKKYYYALVQIMADEQKPELVGQIKVYRFAKKIYEKIQSELNPPQGEGINPLHPIYGRKFSLVITEQSGFPNYDQSQFFDERMGSSLAPSGMWYLNPATNTMEIATEQTDPNVLIEYLKQYSPDLSKYSYQEWSETDRVFVNNVLAVTQNYMQTGTLGTQQQQTMQQSFGVINNSPTPNPIFPGATMPSPSVMGMPQNAQQDVPKPTFEGMMQPQQQTPQFTPPTPPTPQPMTYGNTTTPMTQQNNVTGVEIPSIVNRTNVNVPPTPNRGMDVDDILAQL